MMIALPALATVHQVEVPPSRQQGLDMIFVDPDEMPAEPELSTRRPDVENVEWSGAAVDLLVPMHHLYTDLRRQLSRYQDQWSRLPQIRLPAGGPPLVPGSTDARVPDLRERLGLARTGGFDKALESRLVEFQRAHGLHADGRAGAETIASLNRGAAYYERVLLLNMERARRLPSPETPGRYVLVDAGSARLWLYEDGVPVDSMKVVVGSPESETPMMAALMRFSSVNPYWNVPPELVQTLIAPRVIAQGASYLTERSYEVLDGWEEDAVPLDPRQVDWPAVAKGDEEVRVRQLPGAANSMGDIKFMMPNEYGIYLHDTPNKALFNEEERWVSNGCIRVEDARRLARWLHGEVPKGSASGREERVDLATPVPVYVTYLTAGTDGKGPVFRKDRYGRDAAPLSRFAAEGDGMLDRDERFREAMTQES